MSRRLGWLFALTIVACVLTWIVGAIIGFSRNRMPYVEPGSGPDMGGNTQ